MNQACMFSVLPAVRISDRGRPEFRLYGPAADRVEIAVRRSGRICRTFSYALEPGRLRAVFPGLEGIVGSLEFVLSFYGEGRLLEQHRYPYEIIASGTPSTQLLDGCWISIYHWSESEARWFNGALKQMKDEDFGQHIRDMAAVGIRGVIIQNLFDSAHYVARHSMTVDTYDGRAYYPSALYPGRMPIAAVDPVEAVLAAADECGTHVFLGIGMFAWFDFSPESLEWHKRVAQEVFERYGHHPSFYGWYVSEEIGGDLYTSLIEVPPVHSGYVAPFFREFAAYVHRLAPTKPIAFAPNNINFEAAEARWKEILPYIDVLLPFAFARDLEHMNVDAIKRICTECGTHMWVDMEIFSMPLDNGLVPKSMEALEREIRLYDAVEQVYGYQFTGLLTPPECPFDLGGDAARRLYRDYAEFFRRRTAPAETGADLPHGS